MALNKVFSITVGFFPTLWQFFYVPGQRDFFFMYRDSGFGV